VLNEKDTMWVDLRHKHFADAINDISSQVCDCATLLLYSCAAFLLAVKCSIMPAWDILAISVSCPLCQVLSAKG